MASSAAHPRVLLLTSAGIGGVQKYGRTLENALSDLLGRENVDVISLQGPSKWHKVLFAMRTWTKMLVRRPNLVIGTLLGLHSVLKPFPKKRYWTLVHGIEVWGDLSKEKRNLLLGAEKVLSVSRFTADRICSHHNVPESRIHHQPMIYDSHLLSLPHQNRDSTTSILTVGRMSSSERYKGHENVLRALPDVLKVVPECKYVIVGDGDDRTRLEGIAAEIGVEASVEFRGETTDEELASCYRACSVFAMPALTMVDGSNPKGEGFGIVFLEAMAFGKPVLGPNVGAPAEFIQNRIHGLLVDPTSPSKIASALVEILTNKEIAESMGLAGRELVQSEYSYERFVSRLDSLLSSTDIGRRVPAASA